jgi:PAS domain S-box-containing protein
MDGTRINWDVTHGISASESPSPSGLAPIWIRGYGIALLLVAAALASSLLVQHLFPYPFLFLFFAAVMTSAWLGGTGPGLFAVLVSTLAVDYFFLPPFYSFAINATELAYFAAFVVSALGGSWVSSSQKKNREALRGAHDQLEIRVEERTAELQRANAELGDRERQLRLLTEVIPQQIWSATPDGSIDYCNERLLAYVGRTMDQMRGEGFVETIHAEDRESFLAAWQKALTSSTPLEGEWRICDAGGEYRSFFTRAIPLRGAAQQTLRWYATSTDIEERKRTEQALMNTQVEIAHLARVLTMGELTASIAHEVNQPIAAVVTYGHACVGWLTQSPPNLDEARYAAARIIKDASRAGEVVRRIRSLIKKEPSTRARLDINEVLSDLAAFLQEEAARNHIILRTDYCRDLPHIEGDRVQLQQVLLNLVVNSMEAMQGSTGRPKELLIATARENPEEVVVRVTDSGVGLSPEVSGRIFQPFFTTKSQGIGLGLSISRSIIESHQGRLWASPKASGGAIFQFTLPACP